MRDERKQSPLYQEPLRDYLIDQGSMLFGGLALLVVGVALLSWFLLCTTGVLPWTEEPDLNDKAFGLATTLLATVVAIWMILGDVLPRRRFTVMEEEIRLGFPFKSRKSGLKWSVLKAEDLAGAKLEIDTFYKSWKCSLNLSDGGRYILEEESDEILSALRKFFDLNGIPLAVVEVSKDDAWQKT
jgi:hypothetical protein